MLRDITISPAPHISGPFSTRMIMIDVIIGLGPVMAAAGYYFRYYAVTLISVCVASAIACEWICNRIRKKPNSLGDFSAPVTGIILALSLPPAIPYWAAAIGAAFAIVIGKMVFGGLGANIFNPAMVGRAFLTACFGVLITTWTVPATIDAGMPKVGPDNKIDARTQATPLAWSKEAIKSKKVNANTLTSQLKPAWKGQIAGCLGETSSIAILIGGLYLLIRRTISLHIPMAVLLSAFLFGTIAYFVNDAKYVNPLLHLTSGGLLLGALFIATDPVTAPLTRKGMWIFGIGVGTITILIRTAGQYPEGFMYSVLLMNALTPLIDRLCKPVPAGGKPSE